MKYFVFLFMFLPILSCTNTNKEEAELPVGHDPNYRHLEKVPELTWDEGRQKAIQYQNFYFVGKPDKTTILYAKANGIQVIIDLRAEIQDNENLQQKADAYKITFYSLPLADQEWLNAEKHFEFGEFLDAHKGEKILIVNNDQNISTCWFSTYKSDKSNLNSDATDRIFENLGLTDQVFKERCVKFIDDRE